MRNRLHIFFFSALLCFISPFILCGQDSTHVITVKDITPKKKQKIKFDGKFTFVPQFSNEMGVGIAMSYECAHPLTFIGNFTSKGYMLLGASGNTLSRNKKWQYSYSAFYNHAPSYFWGIGYEAGNIYSNRTGYDLKKLLIGLDMKYRFSSRFSLGPALGYQWVKWDKFEGSAPIASLMDYGIAATFSTRDNASNPSRGIYANFRQKNYSNLSGSTSFQFDFYTGLWEGGIMAFDLYSIFSYGNLPVTLLPSIGGPERMRGYYYGRYRDNNIVSAQVELRQHVWEMIGCSAWIGGANLWGCESHFKIRHTLPNCGLGLRCSVTEKLRFRFDWGFGKNGQNAFIISINEAF